MGQILQQSYSFCRTRLSYLQQCNFHISHLKFHLHYRNPVVCRVSRSLPSAFYWAPGKHLFVECCQKTLGKITILGKGSAECILQALCRVFFSFTLGKIYSAECLKFNTWQTSSLSSAGQKTLGKKTLPSARQKALGK